MIVYGIANCNTIKKAKDWLKNNEINFEFHDYKKKNLLPEKLKAWCKEVGYEKLINKKGTTWRALKPEQQQKVNDENSAVKLMIEKPSVIKRPVIEYNGNLIIGFDEEEYNATFKS